jgi:chromosome segregation ATPase
MAASEERKVVVTNEQEFLARKEKVHRQLEELMKHTMKGKISKPLSAKLEKELNDELREIDREIVENLKRESETIHDQLEVMRTKTSTLESDQNYVSQQIEELEARFRIKRVDRKEYNEKKKTYTQRINQISENISVNNARIGKLEARAKSIAQTLKRALGQ